MKRLVAGLMLLTLTACEDTTTPTQFRNVQVSFATRSAAAPLASTASPRASAAAALDDTLVTGTDTLILASAEIVLREVELKRSDVTDCDSQPDDDGCEEFATGPVLVALPLTQGAAQTFELDIPAGTYSEIEFDIHKVSGDDPGDAAFRQAHPDFVDISIRVTGTFNGQSFVYETDLNVEQELILNPALVVAESAVATNITVFVDIEGWFRGGSGNLLDPESANKGGDNESVVNENIKNSFDAFEDDDRDGER
jgi:hypothetical protein